MPVNDGDPFADATRSFTQGQNQFASMWTDFAGKMATAGVSFSPESTPPDTARQMRSAFFKALSDYCEQYLRSPEFLDSWKQAMDGAIQFRRQMNESLGKMHHDFGGTSRQDVDSVMMALTQLERRLADNIGRTMKRVETVADRVHALEEKVAGRGQPRRAAPSLAPAQRKAAAKTAAARKPAAAKKQTAKKKTPAAKRGTARKN